MLETIRHSAGAAEAVLGAGEKPARIVAAIPATALVNMTL
jgi:hypothetical protein